MQFDGKARALIYAQLGFHARRLLFQKFAALPFGCPLQQQVPCKNRQNREDQPPDALTVDPTVQGIGLGTKFIEYWENYVRERGGKQIVFFTNSQKNLNFYLKRGFEVFDEREIEYNGRKMGSWSLKKEI